MPTQKKRNIQLRVDTRFDASAVASAVENVQTVVEGDNDGNYVAIGPHLYVPIQELDRCKNCTSFKRMNQLRIDVTTRNVCYGKCSLCGMRANERMSAVLHRLSPNEVKRLVKQELSRRAAQ